MKSFMLPWGWTLSYVNSRSSISQDVAHLHSVMGFTARRTLRSPDFAFLVIYNINNNLQPWTWRDQLLLLLSTKMKKLKNKATVTMNQKSVYWATIAWIWETVTFKDDRENTSTVSHRWWSRRRWSEVSFCDTQRKTPLASLSSEFQQSFRDEELCWTHFPSTCGALVRSHLTLTQATGSPRGSAGPTSSDVTAGKYGSKSESGSFSLSVKRLLIKVGGVCSQKDNNVIQTSITLRDFVYFPECPLPMEALALTFTVVV